VKRRPVGAQGSRPDGQAAGDARRGTRRSSGSEPAHPASRPPDPPRTPRVIAALTIAVAFPAAAAGLLLGFDETATPADGRLSELGHAIAVTLGAPALVAIVIAAPALFLWRRLPRTALASAVTALVALAWAGGMALWFTTSVVLPGP